jgi:CheY-like chemotaxis protein
MVAPSRLNLLVTHRDAQHAAMRNPWYQTVTQLLAPLGVRTFEATTAPEAIALIEKEPIHLAVVDTRLQGMGGQLGVLRLIQRIRERNRTLVPPASFEHPQQAEPTTDTRTVRNDAPIGPFRMQVHIQHDGSKGGRIEVHFGGTPGGQKTPMVISPTVILLTPNRDDALLHEALKCDAFSVLTEPVDLNLMLDIMARAMKRFHQNQWPQ